MRERLPGNPYLGWVTGIAAWGKGDVAAFDSLLRVEVESNSQSFLRINAGYTLATLGALQGRVRESRTWQTRAREAELRETPSPAGALEAALDSVTFEATHGQPVAARELLARALRNHPVDDIPAIERPWAWLSFLGAILQDPALAQRALDGWQRDQAALSPTRSGERSRMQAMVAFASGRWREALTLIEAADRDFGLSVRQIYRWRGELYDRLGMPDSALTAWEAFATTRDDELLLEGVWRPRALLRTGELYEAGGNAARAIQFYGEFVALRRDADPELQPQVTEVRQRITRLQRQAG
jgi:tetratricopeptide (TPR) repeat protein